MLLVATVLLSGVTLHRVDASVTLKSFKATRQGDGSIRVDWETATEIDTVAFRVYRSESPNTVGQVVATQQAQGNSVTGATYIYTDPASELIAGRNYYYRLEELTSAGGSSWHGPVNPGGTTSATVNPLGLCCRHRNQHRPADGHTAIHEHACAADASAAHAHPAGEASTTGCTGSPGAPAWPGDCHQPDRSARARGDPVARDGNPTRPDALADASADGNADCNAVEHPAPDHYADTHPGAGGLFRAQRRQRGKAKSSLKRRTTRKLRR